VANQRARIFRRQLTDAELSLWNGLKALNLPHTHFRRQVPIGPYVADFACHAAKLIVEVDGGQHGQDECVASDAERSTFLEARGYKVLRFWNPDVLCNTDAVVETILREVAARTR